MTTNYIPKVGETVIATSNARPEWVYRINIYRADESGYHAKFDTSQGGSLNCDGYFAFTDYTFTPEPTKTTPMKDINNLGRFSVASPDLAMFIALWLKTSHHLKSMPSIDLDRASVLKNTALISDDVEIDVFNGRIEWWGSAKRANHFNTFAEFRAWIETPAITFPNVGGHKVTAGATGLGVGCTPVTWALLDEIHDKSIEWRKANGIVTP